MNEHKKELEELREIVKLARILLVKSICIKNCFSPQGQKVIGALKLLFEKKQSEST